jgi:hypothetical protein
VLWALYQRTGDRTALAEALKAYRTARQTWAEMAQKAKSIYVADIAYGPSAHLRGHWLDRLPAIDADLADMEKAKPAADAAVNPQAIKTALAAALAKPARPALNCRHTPVARFTAGEPLEIALSFAQADGRAVRLHYRHVNQAETWQSGEMQWRDQAYRAAIPAAYTRSPYPLQYYFEVREKESKSIYPGFSPTRANTPYFVVEGTPA